MVHLLNRAELMLTSDLSVVNRISDILSANAVKYRVVIKNSMAAGTVRNGRAGMVPGMTPNTTNIYTIYVRRSDLEYAEHLIK